MRRNTAQPCRESRDERAAGRPLRPTAAVLISLYRRWAHGGAGLLITGNVAIDTAHLIGPYNVVVSETVDANPLQQWATAARSGGAHRSLVEVVRAIRRRVRSTFALAVKLNASDFEVGG